MCDASIFPAGNGDYVEKISELIIIFATDELNWINYFDFLISRAKELRTKEVLRQMKRDEEKHFLLLSNIYENLFIKNITILENYLIFENKNLNMENNMFLKMNSSEFYKKVMFLFKDSYVRDLFFELSEDEQNHAIKFMYLHFKSNNFLN